MSALGRIKPSATIANERPESDRHATVARGSLYFSLLCHFQRVVNFDT